MRVLLVAGARPNFVKIAPLIRALNAAQDEVILVHTGQHYDNSMSEVFFEDLGLPTPHYSLQVGSGSHAQQTAAVMSAFEPVVLGETPDHVVVVGDVNSTLAAALVTAKLHVPLSHVEAGLRSGDWSMPEEVNRVVVDRLSDLLFAPSPDAVDHLRSEGRPDDLIHLVGNVMADTLLHSLERARLRPIVDTLGLNHGDYLLVTLHRPALVDHPDRLYPVVDVLEKIGEHRQVVWPVHPRTRAALQRSIRHVNLIEPQGYLDFVALEAGAAAVLTDSGGVQEESTILGVPCLTLRDSTERPITVTEGTNTVIGTDARAIEPALERIEMVAARRRPELWDGHAADRVISVLRAVGGR